METRNSKRRQTAATREHVAHVCHRLRVEVGLKIAVTIRGNRCSVLEYQGIEFRTAVEHAHHVGHIRGIPATHVERSQCLTIVEH